MKKGFTLAEILIVLTIIGVMAVMTIPSLMQNANSQQKIALFKKAFNTVNNAYATEFAIKTPPTTYSERDKLWDALINQINVKYYYTSSIGIALTADISSATFTKSFSKLTGSYKCWLVSEDGISYTTYNYGSANGRKKLDQNAYKKSTYSFLNIFVDINGMDKPNKLCPDDVDLDKLNNCDIMQLPVTVDGITAGNPDCTIAGRIMSDNTTYDGTKCQEASP